VRRKGGGNSRPAVILSYYTVILDGIAIDRSSKFKIPLDTQKGHFVDTVCSRDLLALAE